MKLLPFSTTGIGSMPQRDPYFTVNLIFENFDIPYWPQLPKYSEKESMIAQFTEGLPGVFFENSKLFFKKDESLINDWLINYNEDLVSPITEEFSKGLYVIKELLKDKKLKVLKGQLTGPLTFTLSIKDEKGNLIYFDETIRELSILHLKAKAKWQVNFLKDFADDLIIFIDEPILQAIGASTYISVNESEALRLIKEIVLSLKAMNVLVGLHCCGKADWSKVLSLGVDLISFDSYFFFDFFKIYRDEIYDFLKKGGYIAWGVVPTTNELKTLSDGEIIKKALLQIEEFENTLSKDRSILTPSCGMGSLEESDSLRVIKLLKEIQKKVNG
ncbi:MAG: hypothetical protein NZ809_03045 [Thermodesulfovibrio sp.]|nr:hypothetical protein [Thermodesulfovibrio sp.]